MAKVTKHQAKDGSLWNTARECDAHDRKLRIKPAMVKFAEALAANSPGITTDHDGNPAIYMLDLPTFLTEHAEALRDAIDGALTVRRKPRAKKTAEKPAAAATGSSE